MTHGVKINGVDTKATYGLILLADVNIGAAKLKSEYVDVPGANGSLNYSYALTGSPTYSRRTITFTLFAPLEDEDLEETRQTLANLYHGKEVTLYLPDDTTRYFKGVLSIGSISGYNSGRIPCELNAEPFRFDSNGGESL